MSYPISTIGRKGRIGPYLLLALVVGLALLSAYQVAAKPFGQARTEDGTWEVLGSTAVGQTFMAPFDGLYRVDVFVSPGGGASTRDMVLRLRKAPDATEDLAFDVVNASSLSYGRWVTFEFAPIPDSGGSGYYFVLESPPPEEGRTLSVFRSRTDRYRDGTAYLGGTPADGDLAFLLYSRPGPIGWLSGLFRVLAQAKPSLAGQPTCYGVLLAVYVVLLVLVVRHLSGSDTEDKAS